MLFTEIAQTWVVQRDSVNMAIIHSYSTDRDLDMGLDPEPNRPKGIRSNPKRKKRKKKKSTSNRTTNKPKGKKKNLASWLRKTIEGGIL